MAILILQGPNLNEHFAESITTEVGGELEKASHFFKIKAATEITRESLTRLREKYDFDINQLPQEFNPNRVRLLIMDMDSTFINIECVDELADFMGIKPEIAAITESAMRGEIDFKTSLTRRIGLLTGLSADALDHVYQERLKLNPHGETMLEGLKSKDIKIGLVSGGFTFFTDRLKQKYQLDYTLANTLDIYNGKLTGKVKGSIIGAEAKANFLKQICDELNIQTDQAIAMGDGANDLKMMSLAGFSIAFHAKPKVQAHADAALNHCGLEGVLGLLDIERR